MAFIKFGLETDQKITRSGSTCVHGGIRFKTFRGKLSLIVLSILFFWVAIFPLLQVQAPDLDSEIPLEGDITLRAYPDGNFEFRASGLIEETHEYYTSMTPIREAHLLFSVEPLEENLYEGRGNLVLKLGPQFALFLSSLDLDIELHAERLGSEATIQVGLPGMIEVNGTVKTTTEEGTFEGSIEAEMTAKIWYSLLSKETIQQFLVSLPLFEAQFESQLDEYSDGSLKLAEFTLIDSELGEISATITAGVRVAGDFGVGISAIAESFASDYTELPVDPSSPPEDWLLTALRSADFHVFFDNEDLAFIVEFEGEVEGDIDEQVNTLKDLLLEELLVESDMDPEAERFIIEVMLPTEFSVENLELSFNMTLEGEITSTGFLVDHLILKSLDSEALLFFLEKASNEEPNEELTLTLMGMSEGNRYIEILVPDETTPPLSKSTDRVVWAFANLENIDRVAFEVKEKSSGFTSPGVLVPAVGAVAVVAAAAWFYLSRRG